MGLIKAITGAAGGVLADQWREFFICESLDKDVLVAKGEKRTSGRSSNTKGSDNIITNGSGIAVNEGQAMIIVDNGKIVEFTAEPGNFTYDTSTEPSIFYGDLGTGIIDSLKKVGERFTFGADTGHDQRVYYFNTKEIMDNKYGTATPIPFKVIEDTVNSKFTISLRCNGTYSYKIVDPVLFYTNVCGNVSSVYKRSEIDAQLKSELLTALQPAFSHLSAKRVDYSEIPGYAMEIARDLNQILSEDWRNVRGLEIVRFGINSIAATEEDEARIKQAQMAAAMSNPMYAAGYTTVAQGEAMRTAAGNEAGAMNAFMGMGMAGMMGGFTNQQAGGMFATGQQMGYQGGQYQQPMQQPAQQQPMQQPGQQQPMNAAAPAAAPAGAPAAAADTWTCSCGHQNTGKFCMECGSPKPAPEPEPQGWACPTCGTVNQGKFCHECGGKKPAEAPLYKCDKCGWMPPDPKNPPKFCPECGDRFDENDIQQ